MPSAPTLSTTPPCGVCATCTTSSITPSATCAICSSRSAHRDPDLTTFLTIWTFEEFWHGEAIATVLRAHGEPAGGRIAPLRRRLGWRDRVAPLVHGLGSAVVGAPYTAVHMTWGAVNEWTTQAGYARLAARARHPVLTELLRRIMRQEGRHIDFYARQAIARLDADRRAQRLTRAPVRSASGSLSART